MRYVLHGGGGEGAKARPRRHVGAEYAPEGGDGCLTREQKTRLVVLARRGWERSGKPGGEREFDTWRRAEAVRACGLRISEARQRDWGVLKAAYEDAAGESGRAFNTLMRDQDNARRVALYKLTQACGERGLPLAYAQTICSRQYRCSLHEASAAQVWRIFFTVKNRRQKK